MSSAVGAEAVGTDLGDAEVDGFVAIVESPGVDRVLAERNANDAAKRREDGISADGSRRAPRNETGAVLILALVYIISVSLIVGALASWAMNNLNNTSKFQSATQFHYALSGAMNTAISSIRYNPVPTNPTSAQYSGTATPLGACWGTGATSQVSQVNGYTVDVWCSTVINLAQKDTRTVSFYACSSSVSSAQCQSTPSLSAVVAFDDYPSTGGVLLAQQCNLPGTPWTPQCGSGQTLKSWVWG